MFDDQIRKVGGGEVYLVVKLDLVYRSRSAQAFTQFVQPKLPLCKRILILEFSFHLKENTGQYKRMNQNHLISAYRTWSPIMWLVKREHSVACDLY